ncbi:heavy metal-binding domain-containing protein [Flavobacterium sp. GNP001]
MKKIIFSAIIMAFVLVSCNQKTKEESTTDYEMMENDSTTMKNDGTMMEHDSTMTDHSKMDHSKMYACSMHPEVQGKMNDKCSKCGMKLTEPVPENGEGSK